MNRLTPTDWEVIRDALEMRSKECVKLCRELSSGTGRNRSEVDRRLALTFKVIGEKAEATLTKLEELNLC